MYKLAQFANHYRNLGAQAALSGPNGMSKVANLGRFLPKSRIGKLGLGVGAGAAGLAGYNAVRPDPSMMDTIGDSLNSVSQEDLMGYASMLGSLGGGSGMDPYGMMGYEAIPGKIPGATEEMYPEYDMSDIGDFDTAELDDDAMGYSRAMSPEEEAQYLSYYGG